MRVTLIQMDIVWGDIQANLDKIDEVLDSADRADLYVLPEMFTTGFATPAGATVEKGAQCIGLEWMKRKAVQLDAALAGSIALELPEGKCVNRLYFVKPDGEVSFYDKHHLFEYGGEGEKFSSGDSQLTVSWRGVRFRLAVCYDLRFPVWLRNKDDYDALILVASWPTKRRYAWDILIRARAIENQCYMLAANRIGEDPECTYDGGTVLLNPYGYVIAAADDNSWACVSGEIDMEALESYRAKFPILPDADPFTLG